VVFVAIVRLSWMWGEVDHTSGRAASVVRIHHLRRPNGDDGLVRTMVERPRRPVKDGQEVRLLVLSASALGLAAVDLTSGAVVRAGARGLDRLDLRPFDVVRARLAVDAEPLDPTQPEAVALAGPPRPLGRLSPRQIDRWLRPVLHPEWSHLLGFAGPSIPFWELEGSRPSVAVAATRAVVTVGDDGLVRCRFLWRTLVHDLPVDACRGAFLPREAERIVVALTPPIDGHCHKVVTGLI